MVVLWKLEHFCFWDKGMKFYKVNYAVEFRQRNAAHNFRGGSPLVVQCEDKCGLRDPDKKDVNFYEHGVKTVHDTV